ncbi:hypothetical protein GJ744_000239 [Endocarpon pusillum]|uniref:Uncharacterized protein n=1 Tax=Endocarpon pusillum TaxID=364733 RepID=A0A8H7AU70_9EURO|nr:hypothetical protein GJ744_000239 [Endocarpon pusillum]
MAASARSACVGDVALKRGTGGGAANLYDEIQSATRSSDKMTWQGEECLLLKKELIIRWMRQIAEMRDASVRVVTETINPQMIEKILCNTEEIKKQQLTPHRATKSYS